MSRSVFCRREVEEVGRLLRRLAVVGDDVLPQIRQGHDEVRDLQFCPQGLHMGLEVGLLGILSVYRQPLLFP